MTSRHTPRKILRARQQETSEDAIARVMRHGRPHIAEALREFERAGIDPDVEMLMVVDAQSILFGPLGHVAGLHRVNRTKVINALGQLESRTPEILRARDAGVALLRRPPACGHPELLLALPTVGRILCAICAPYKILEPDRALS